jgi:integrase
MSIHKRQNGSWEVRYRDLSNRNRSRSFKLKSGAEDFERSTLLDLKRGNYLSPDAGQIRLKEVWNQWKDSKALAAKTMADYESLWRTHIEPKFGNVSLAQIKPIDIQKWNLESIAINQLSGARRDKATTLLSNLLDYSIDLGYISKNVAKGANGKVRRYANKSIKKVRKKTITSFSDLSLLSKFVGEYESLILVAGLIGLRWSEIVGLQVEDVDLINKRLTVRRAIVELGGLLITKDTKTNKTRHCPIPEILIPKLEKQILNKSAEDLLFPDRNGRPLRNSNFKRDIYHPALKAAGMDKMSLLDLRSSFGTNALRNSNNLVGVSKIMGHSSFTTTLKHYVVPSLEDLEKVSKAMNDSMLALGPDVRILFAPNNFQVTEEPNAQINYPLTSVNESGPCRDRTDDPQIKSLLLYRLS